MDSQVVMPEPGEIFAGLRIVSLLGSGNNGVVYLARQESLDREVALKILRPEFSEDPEYADMLIHEARSAARLNHPNIVQAIDAGSERGISYLVMEYVRGRTLKEILARSPETVDMDFLLGIGIQLADALGYAWESFSMIHGDIKPENLMICDGSRELKLADLGLSRISGHADPDDGSFMATPLYVAPEVIEGSCAQGVRGDIYSCGVMFYEFFAGRPPFSGNVEHLLHCHLEEAPPPLEEAAPGVPHELARFVHRMLAKEPAERPASWREVEKFLQAVRAGKAVSPDPSRSSRSSAGAGGNNRLLLWAGIAAGALAAIIAAALITLVILTSCA